MKSISLLNDILYQTLDEGKFNEFLQLINSSEIPLTQEQIADYILRKAHFVHIDDEITLVQCTQPSDWKSIITRSIKASFECKGLEWYCLYSIRRNVNDTQQAIDAGEDMSARPTAFNRVVNFKAITTIFTIEELLDIIAFDVIIDQKYRIFDFKDKSVTAQFRDRNHGINGVLLPTGHFVECGYMEHNSLFPLLSSLNIASSGDWTDDDNCIHVSSSQLNGTIAHCIEDNYHDKEVVSEDQLTALFNARDILDTYDGRSTTLAKCLLGQISRVCKGGGKYNNLKFLQKYYPTITLPKFSNKVLDLEYPMFIRTSPKDSIPGLLNSALANNISEMNDILEKTFKSFDQVKHVKSDKDQYMFGKQYCNELHLMYQEFIEGANGVCNINHDRLFTYQLSTNQGDIVNGKVPNTELLLEYVTELHSIADRLYQDFQHEIQLEFVVNDDGLYIVQMRLFDSYDSTLGDNKAPEQALITGKSFSKYYEQVDVEDILIVDQDAHSSELISKKGLIVINDTQFSHILALSKVLKIPSIYHTDVVEIKQLLSDHKKVIFNTCNKQGWIEPIK